MVRTGRDPNAFDNTLDGLTPKGNVVNGGHEGKGGQDASRFQQRSDLLTRPSPLEFLTVEEGRFEAFPRLRTLVLRGAEDGRRNFLPCPVGSRHVVGIGGVGGGVQATAVESFFGKCFRAPSIASTVTGRNEIGHATTLCEGLVLNTVKEQMTEPSHFTQSNP